MRAIMLATLALASALAFGVVAPSWAADWSVQRFPSFGFSAAFPDTASRKTEAVASEGGAIPTDYFYVHTDDRTYFVSSSDVSSQPDVMAKPDEASRSILQGAVGTGTVLVAPSHVGSPNGWEATYQTDDLVVRIRTYVKARRGFTAMILTRRDTRATLTDANAERFFSGFHPD